MPQGSTCTQAMPLGSPFCAARSHSPNEVGVEHRSALGGGQHGVTQAQQRARGDLVLEPRRALRPCLQGRPGSSEWANGSAAVSIRAHMVCPGKATRRPHSPSCNTATPQAALRPAPTRRHVHHLRLALAHEVHHLAHMLLRHLGEGRGVGAKHGVRAGMCGFGNAGRSGGRPVEHRCGYCVEVQQPCQARRHSM